MGARLKLPPSRAVRSAAPRQGTGIGGPGGLLCSGRRAAQRAWLEFDGGPMSTPTVTGQPVGGQVSDFDANHARRWWILAVLGVAQLMVILDNTIVNIALPTAQHALHFSNADRQWVVTGYSLAFGSLLLLGGRIGDIIGRKRALLVGLIGFAGASALGGASINFAMLVIARTVQGAFGALLAPSVLALLTTTFTNPAERGKAFAIYGGHRRSRRGHRTPPRRHPHLLRVVALDPLRQPGLCRHRQHRRHAVAEERQGRRPRPLGHPRAAPGDRGPLLSGLRLLPRRDHSLEQPVHHRVPGPRRGAPGRVRLRRDAGPATPCCHPGWCATGPGGVRCWPCCSPASASSGSSSSSPTTCRRPSDSAR